MVINISVWVQKPLQGPVNATSDVPAEEKQIAAILILFVSSSLSYFLAITSSGLYKLPPTHFIARPSATA